MKKLSRAMSSRWMSFALSHVVLGALCFSAGEGLRLTPIPGPTPTPAETDWRLAKASFSQYGPLYVPAQTQKRSKRPVLEIAGPVVARTPDFVPVLSASLDAESTDVASVFSLSHPPGRAPPSVF